MTKIFPGEKHGRRCRRGGERGVCQRGCRARLYWGEYDKFDLEINIGFYSDTSSLALYTIIASQFVKLPLTFSGSPYSPSAWPRHLRTRPPLCGDGVPRARRPHLLLGFPPARGHAFPPPCHQDPLLPHPGLYGGTGKVKCSLHISHWQYVF